MGRINNDAAFFMSYVRARIGQVALLSRGDRGLCVVDAPVRVIDAFVRRARCDGPRFAAMVPVATGRPPYDPRDYWSCMFMAT